MKSAEGDSYFLTFDKTGEQRRRSGGYPAAFFVWRDPQPKACIMLAACLICDTISYGESSYL